MSIDGDLSPERSKSNPEAKRAVTSSLQGLFMDLKEYGSSLTQTDIESLIRSFTPEVDEYIGALIKRMKEARENKQ